MKIDFAFNIHFLTYRAWNVTLDTWTNSPASIFDAAYNYTSIPEGESQLCDKIVQAFGSGSCTIKPDMITIYRQVSGHETTVNDVSDDSSDNDGIKIMTNEQGLIISLLCAIVIVIIIIAVLVYKLSTRHQRNKHKQKSKDKDLTMVKANRAKSMSGIKPSSQKFDANRNNVEIVPKKEVNLINDDQICYRSADVNDQTNPGERDETFSEDSDTREGATTLFDV